MSLPSPKEATDLLSDAAARNPGPWVDHSLHAASAARSIAAHHPRLDADTAFVMGALHDIGRRFGVSRMRHIIDGHRFMNEMGYERIARICLTHSFPVQDIGSYVGPMDCSEGDVAFVRDYLSSVVYDDYDRLIQLCDALAMPTGTCLLEKRMVDVVLRYGFNELTVAKWRKTLEIRKGFEEATGRSIYSCLPGVVENTFALDGRPPVE